jgi:hypothetical protein
MTSQVSTEGVSERLLANRELLSLDRARVYLGSRARVRTPLGASEFLGVCASHDRETYDKRVRIALDCLELYRILFPEEYARSHTPLFSTQREHEFYRLVHRHLFPLLLSEDVDIETHLQREPNFFLPFIPMRGTQRHIWAGGCFHFQQIETVFKVAQVLSWMTGAGGRGWMALKMYFGLHGIPEPAPPLAAVGWSLFVYSCSVEGAPLSYLPLAFHMISYRTGNPWLDLPQIGYVGFEWSGEKIAELVAAQEQADEINAKIAELDKWLDADPVPRIGRIVELWNSAARAAELSGFAGAQLPPGQVARFNFPEAAIREVYGEAMPLQGDVRGQLAALTLRENTGRRGLHADMQALPGANRLRATEPDGEEPAPVEQPLERAAAPGREPAP